MAITSWNSSNGAVLGAGAGGGGIPISEDDRSHLVSANDGVYFQSLSVETTKIDEVNQIYKQTKPSTGKSLCSTA